MLLPGLDMTLTLPLCPALGRLSCMQLDKLRTIIESMMSSSSTLLSMSISPHKPASALAPGQLDLEGTCPACSLDVSHQVSLLVQRYEQLQDMVSGLAASRPSKKAKLQSQVRFCSAPSQGYWRRPLVVATGGELPSQVSTEGMADSTL